MVDTIPLGSLANNLHDCEIFGNLFYPFHNIGVSLAWIMYWTNVHFIDSPSTGMFIFESVPSVFEKKF